MKLSQIPLVWRALLSIIIFVIQVSAIVYGGRIFDNTPMELVIVGIASFLGSGAIVRLILAERVGNRKTQ